MMKNLISNYNDNNYSEAYVYSPELHMSLLNNKLDTNEHVYLVSLRVLKKDTNIIVYSYISYPEIFLNSLIYYLIRKENFKASSSYLDWGDYLTLIDYNLGSNDFIRYLLDKILILNKHWVEYMESDEYYKHKPTNYTTYFDSVKKTTLTLDTDKLIECINFAARKEFNKFIDILLKYQVDNLEFNDVYVLRDCIFLVKDINSFIESLKSKDFIVNKGPKSDRDKINSMTSHLSCVDRDYRDYLYRYQKLVVKNGLMPSECLLSRSKFSFRNIHINMGNTRLYSTKKKVSTSRQNLFQNNYTLIQNILEKNYYVGGVDIQLKIEKELRNQEKMFSDLNAMKTRLNFDENTYDYINKKYKDLINLMSYKDVTKVSKKIDSKYKPLVLNIIKVLGKDEVAKLLLSYYMEILTRETETIDDTETETPGLSTLKVFHKFGKSIFGKFVYAKYESSDMFKNGSLSEYINSIKKEFSDVYDVADSYTLFGGYFVWNLVTVDLLKEEADRHPENNMESMNYIRIVNTARTKLIKKDVITYHLPQRLPMVCLPKDYHYSIDAKDNKLGGHLLNDVYYADSLIKDKIGHEKSTFLRKDNIIIKMVNRYMKTPYKINNNVLEYIYLNGVDKKIVLDESKEIINFKNDPHNKSFKNSPKYRSLVSKIVLERNIISIAETYSKVKEIYFPVRLDFRTRIYCNTDYFDFQKSDLAKGLILFANPGHIRKSDEEIIKYFKAYGANMFGSKLDKKSLNYRAKWVDQNTDKLLDFKNNDIVDQAESKTCFVAFCFEYTRFMNFMSSKEELVFKTYLPIQLDATCNGYQHLSLLTKETKLLSKLNLGPSSHEDDPDDFYSFVSDNIKSYLISQINILSGRKDLANLDVWKLNGLKKLASLNFGRSIVKLAVMRESYSAGVHSLVKNISSHESVEKIVTMIPYYDMVKKEYKEKPYYEYRYNDSITFTKADILTYVLCLKHVIGNIAPKIAKLSKYLDGIVNICSKLNIPIPWGLPHGADIPQSYLMKEERKISAFSFTKSKYTFLRYQSGKYDSAKQKRSIRPNLIHSLDATTIALLYNSLNGRVDLYTVHDCFAVTANNVPMLINKLKLVYIKLYSSDSYLSHFDKMVRININNSFGDNIFKVEDNYINIPNKNTLKRTPFPNIKDIINLEKDKLEVVSFPDVSAITKPNSSIDTLKYSTYPIV